MMTHHIDSEALGRIHGGGQAIYNTLNKVMPKVDSDWSKMSCVERSASIGMYGNIASGTLGLAAGVSAATPAAPAAPFLGAGAVVVGTGSAVLGTQYLKQCNAIEGKK
jgi:hypothetical protein